ncbi:MAG: hypothetical protein KAU20_03550, partial [Nanoarchaeota archaeon]|nr:hypothetical protein [Nanoarchaeota archaeon]
MREIKVKIPTKDTDIKVGQYQEYIKLITSFKGEIVYNEFMKMKLVSIFCNVPFQLVKSGFTSADVDSISTKVLTVLDKVKKLEDANIEPIVKVGKTEFGFITDMEEMSAGTYADLTEV